MSLVVQHIKKSFGSQQALMDLSFTLNPGTILGFLGPNGAGKSTAMKILSGYLKADEGEIFINQLPFTGHEIELKRNIGYLPETNALYQDMYVREYLNFVADVYKLEDSPSKIFRCIQELGITEHAHKKIGQLSKGFKQRVGLAQALLPDPALLILDEATNGLDPNQMEEIRVIIKRFASNRMVIFSSHSMEEVEAICDQVLILDKGIIKVQADWDTLKAQYPDKSLATVFKNLTTN